VIRVAEPWPDRRMVRPGMVLVRLVTDRGKLLVEF
jgi:hypothetical protein